MAGPQSSTARSSRGGGCTFAEDPVRSCAEVTPIWSVDVDPCVLRVRCHACQAGDDGAFDIRRHHVRVARGCRGEHVCIEVGGEPIRLDAIDGSVLGGPVQIEAAIMAGRNLDAQISSLKRVDRIVRGIDARAPPDRHLARLALALRTLDARTCGASLRTIAGVILAAPEWPGDGECVKSSARRLVALADALRCAGPASIVGARVGPNS